MSQSHHSGAKIPGRGTMGHKPEPGKGGAGPDGGRNGSHPAGAGDGGTAPAGIVAGPG